ncbi:TetR/AcrR family transcriptional regulator [Bacillus sp. LLTC93]|uniref:TetR/AcrR family transcriptional regulator n=1 Tax=Bacillus sp. LLTC93 TaxID=2108274 RepID=UPI000D01593C|nr:TetR/AcrR family transcriptional regulator [Bacillus sp. LLTC93]PRO41637.1 TetR family transcriptional regulator [Bacillus sp. LLTC93]
MTPNKQQSILDAALKLFANRGYDGITIPMIAREAKVGTGTLYHYFKSKEELINYLFQSSVEKFKNTMLGNFTSSAGDVREQFRYLFFQMVQFSKENHALLFIDSHVNQYYLNEKSNKLFNDFLELLKELLENAKDRGFICNLPSDALIAIVYGAFVRLYKIIEAGQLEESEELISHFEERCWKAIRI